MIFGAIDIGTNAARLLIGEVRNENNHQIVKKISYTRVPLQLGFEVFENGEISKAKLAQFTKTMKAFKLLSEVYGVEALRACATSAMREATNSGEITQHIQLKTGIEIEIIDGRTEGDLIISSFDLIQFDKSNPYLVVDVGGGSTEISMFKNGKRLLSKSFKIGTIRILKNKVKPNVLDTIKSWVSENISPEENWTVFATGGNINRVQKLIGSNYMDAISVKSLKKLYKDIEPLTPTERIEKYRLKKDRSEVIAPALNIYLTIFGFINASSIFIPRIGLSDGMIYTMYKLHKNHNHD